MCNGSANATALRLCEEAALRLQINETTEWPLERVVSMVVPFFFGIIGLIGLMGNALVILGKIAFNFRNIIQQAGTLFLVISQSTINIYN